MIQMVQLHELMGQKSLSKLIVFFTENPTLESSYTEIRGKVKLTKATLTKWLKFMVERELITSKSIGRSRLYKLNRMNVLMKHLKILNNITKLMLLKKIGRKLNCEIFIYGSVARGEDIEKSDIDVLILGNVKPQKISGEIRKMEKKLGRDIKVQIFTKVEWANMERKDKAFYERVEKDKIRLG